MTQFVSISRPIHPVAARRPLGVRLLDALALHRQRRRLAKLDADALRDIGLTRTDALREARRPVWDVPAHWLG